MPLIGHGYSMSLSARRAWIEIAVAGSAVPILIRVALRKESVDRNMRRLEKRDRAV